MIVGGFYGVLNKTGAYKKLLDKIVTKFKPKSKEFVFAIIILFALITALTGLTIPLLVFIPFIVSIILLMGYDKLVAISATFGAIIMGFIGGIFITVKDPSNYYAVSYTTIDKFVGLESNFVNLFPKIFLLCAAVGLLIFYVNRHIKNVEDKKVKYDINDNTDIMIAEVKGSYKDIKVWPLIVVLSLIFVLMILGMVSWAGVFNIDVFTTFHTWLTGLEIKKFAVFNNIISANFAAFGEWLSLGNYMMLMIVLILFSFIIKLVCKIKFDDALDGFLDGMKKMLPTAVLVALSFTVLVCTYNNGFMETIINKAGNFNIGLTSLVTLLGSLLNIDLYYTASGIFTPMLTLFTNESILTVVAILFQSLYGFVMLLGPTSTLLIIGLTYLEVPYTTWLKYIWRFALALFIIIFFVLLIVSLI